MAISMLISWNKGVYRKTSEEEGGGASRIRKKKICSKSSLAEAPVHSS